MNAPDPANAPLVRPSGNVASHLRRQASLHPERDAVRVQRAGGGWDRIDYASLEARSDALARGLAERGLGPGDRTSLFVRPGIELIALTYALFKVGAVPVLIDPGMGRKRLLECVARMEPKALVGIPRAQVARWLAPSAFRSLELSVSVGGPFPGCVRLEELEEAGASSAGSFPMAEPDPRGPDAPAVILFTSGSTGPPKGVVATHAILQAQLGHLRSLYALEPGEVDLACFPLFALFDTALGLTSAFPRLDPSRPGRCDPATLARALTESGASVSFGSPAIWRRLVPWCRARGRRFPDLSRVLIAGAPVPPALIEDLLELLPAEGDVHTPYGATECLPVSSASGRELSGALRAAIEGGAGTCVGRPVPGLDVRLIAIGDEALDAWDPGREVPDGELGEICVRGDVVTPRYEDDAEATRLAKIPSPEGLWHRMGDVGYRDSAGRLWFCGRKSHRLETRGGVLLPVPTENVFNTHPAVNKSALVGVGARGAEEPVLLVELEARAPFSSSRREALASAIGEHGRAHAREDLGRTEPRRVIFHPRFPVDVRHNAKIKRGELKRWAEERVR